MSRALWPHQEEGFGLLRRSLMAGARHPMLQIATGGGKTRLAAEIIFGAMRKGSTVVFVVPTISLIDQTVEAFGQEGITAVGVIQADHPLTDPRQPIQVASVQTLRRRNLPKADLVIVDEAHMAFKVIFRWMEECPNLPFIGLSATPWSRGLGKRYDDLIIAATTSQLIEAGFLSQFRVYAPSHPDLSGVKTVAGDYHEGQLAEVMDKPELTADVVRTWLNLGEDRPTLCFGVNRAHARQLRDDFEKAGVPAAYIDAHTDRAEREVIRKAFHAGAIKVVCNIGTLTVGIDWDVRCLILARPTKSEMLYTQIVGRGLRRAEGKDDCIILDHSDTTLNLGFVTDIHHDRLNTGKEATAGEKQVRELSAPKLPKECPSCTRLKPVGVHKCPSCGFAPERQSEIEFAEGELVQVKGKKRQVTMAEKQVWYSGLISVGRERKYKPGWAKQKFRDKFGVWPAHELSERPGLVAPEVRRWLKSETIRWVKGSQKGQAHATA